MSLDPIKRPVEDSAAPPADADPQTRRETYADFVEREQRQEVADLSAVMATDAGRRVLLRILAVGDIYEPSPSLGGEFIARNEGRRDAALWLIKQLYRVRADAYPNLLIYHAHMKQKRLSDLAAFDAAAVERP